MAIRSALTRMSPGSQVLTSTSCMVATSSRPASAACRYTGSVTSNSLPLPCRGQQARLVAGIHVGVADVPPSQRRGGPVEQALAPGAGRQLGGDPADRRASPSGQRPAGPDHARLVVDAVSAEQLVGALAGQHHLDVLARLAGREPQRDGGRVRHRVVQVPDDPGQAGEELLRADHVGDGLDAERGRRGHGVVDLAVALALESDGEGQQAGRGLGRERAEGGRVHPAGQERADRHVAAQVNGDRVAHRGQDLVRRA